MTYYDELLNQIETLKQSNPSEAYQLIITELKMPYIDPDFEQQLHLLEKQLRPEKQVISKTIDIYQSLFEETTFFKTIDALQKLNIRQYLDVLEQYLLGDYPDLHKGYIVSMLIEQQIYDEIKMKKDYFDIVFVPNQIEMIEEQDITQLILKTIEDRYHKMPFLIDIGKSLFYDEALKKLPFTYEQSDVPLLIQNIDNKLKQLYMFDEY